MTPEEREKRVTQLKDEIVRTTETISKLEGDKKEQNKSFKTLIDDKKKDRELCLDELKEIRIDNK